MAIKKRASVTPAAGVGKKQRTALKQCSAVSEAVLGAQNFSEKFSEKVLTMVSVGVRGCLGVPKENRNAFQEKVIQMAGDVLNSVEAGIQNNIESCQTKLSAASTEKSTLDEAREAAALEVTTKANALEVVQAAVWESFVARNAAKAAVTEAEAAQEEGDADLEAASGKKANFDSVLNEFFTPLMEGYVEGPDAQDCIAALSKLGKEFLKSTSLDGSMLKSLPGALAKSPSERGMFDAMVLGQLEDELTKRIKALQETIANGEPAMAERASAVEAAKEALEAAKSCEASCKHNLHQSEVELKEGKAVLKAAKQAVSQFGLEMKQVERDLKSTKASLVAFTEGALAAFKELVDFTAILPPTSAQETEGTPDAAATVPAQ